MTNTGNNYDKAYASLNPEQKLAVDTIDGPVLVVAGPGTGKTQLLSTRVGKILKSSDTNPQNILCLTFSDAGVVNMQNRLIKILNSAAYDINVLTYHSFGSGLIQQYWEEFGLEKPPKAIETIEQLQVMEKIIQDLDYANSFKKNTDLKSILKLISNYKRSLITPAILDQRLKNDQNFIDQAQKIINNNLSASEKISIKLINNFETIYQQTNLIESDDASPISPLIKLYLNDLANAIEEAKQTNKSNKLTAWKDNWLEKYLNLKYVIKDSSMIKKQLDFNELYIKYIDSLKQQGIYDYDDMILFAIEGLNNNPEIKINLQEKYFYILLDEFQDTNESQLKLVDLIVDNPINENRPNILAVGDDDQAIYSFQGANYSNMQNFINKYRDVKIINLTINYRSTPTIIESSQAIRQQIEDKLPIGNKKQISNNTANNGFIERVELNSVIDEHYWIAQRVKELQQDKTVAGNIAIIFRQHNEIESIIPYFHQQNIPVTYSKLGDVLKNEAINELFDCMQLIDSLESNRSKADSLWPRVLSMDFWAIPTISIWEIGKKAKETHQSWTDSLLNDPELKTIALFFIKLSQIKYKSYDLILNYLIGSLPLKINDPLQKEFTSPLYMHIIQDINSSEEDRINIEQWMLISNLTTIREYINKLSDDPIDVSEFLKLISLHISNKEEISNQFQLNEDKNSVELLTAHAAKGLEFDTVFIPSFNDNKWGKKYKGQNKSISLPHNLNYIRNLSDTDDEKLRLLFVITTRAKNKMIISNTRLNDKNKPTIPLAYSNLNMETNEDLFGKIKYIEPSNDSSVNLNKAKAAWHERHLFIYNPNLKSFLENKVRNFKLNPTKLNSYLNLEYSGPTKFYLKYLLDFPEAESLDMLFGTIIHASLDWQFNQTIEKGQTPDLADVLEIYQDKLSKMLLSKQEYDQLLKRGVDSLTAYLNNSHILNKPEDESEKYLDVNFKGIKLNGKIDRLIIDKHTKTIQVIDFKTGSSIPRLSSDIKSYNYKQQLYFYKLLLDNSPQYKGYSVEKGTIQFIEPSKKNSQIEAIDLLYEEDYYQHLKKLIKIVWDNTMNLNFPNTEIFEKTISGTKKFESFLLSEQEEK